MVEGRITSAGKTVARVGGIMSRLTLPDEDTVLTTTILAAKAPKSKKQSRTSTNDEDQDENQNRMGRRDRQGQEQQDLAAVEDLSFAHTIGIQKAVRFSMSVVSEPLICNIIRKFVSVRRDPTSTSHSISPGQDGFLPDLP